MSRGTGRGRAGRFVMSTLVAVLASWLGADRAEAQFSGANNNIYAATRNYLYNRPTVSPYLNLTTRDNSVGLSNYFTLVRPQIEEQQNQMANRQQQAQIQRQIADVQNQVRQTQEQNAGISTTGQLGWSARGYPRFGMYLNFYPGMNQIPRRR